MLKLVRPLQRRASVVAFGEDNGSGVDLLQERPPPGLALADAVLIGGAVVVADVHLQAPIAVEHLAQQLQLEAPGASDEDVDVRQVDGEGGWAFQQRLVLVPGRQQIVLSSGGVHALDSHTAAEQVFAAASVVEHLTQRGIRSLTWVCAVGWRI